MNTVLESSPARSTGSDDRHLFNYRAFDEARLGVLADELAAARPFPHLVIDDFVGVSAGEVVSAFPPPDWRGWRAFNDAYQFNKRHCADIDALPPLFQAMIHDLCGPAFLRFLERVSGIRGLLPDPYLVGGGLHSSGAGGVLAPHADFHHYPRLELFRRINVLVYFNSEWKSEFGGCLELYEKGASRPEREVVPEFGRMVMFLTDDRSVMASHDLSQAPPAGAIRWRYIITRRTKPGSSAVMAIPIGRHMASNAGYAWSGCWPIKAFCVCRGCSQSSRTVRTRISRATPRLSRGTTHSGGHRSRIRDPSQQFLRTRQRMKVIVSGPASTGGLQQPCSGGRGTVRCDAERSV